MHTDGIRHSALRATGCQIVISIILGCYAVLYIKQIRKATEKPPFSGSSSSYSVVLDFGNTQRSITSTKTLKLYYFNVSILSRRELLLLMKKNAIAHPPIAKKQLTDIQDLLSFSTFQDLYRMLNRLESMAIVENWKYNIPRPEARNTQNPILENYIHHTFRRLIAEFKLAKTEDERQKIIYTDANLACFNTGLFTKNYNMIYALFYPNTSSYQQQPYFCYGFVEESDPKLNSIIQLPRRANYFSHISELLYDTSLPLRSNIEHILQDNISRFPQELQQNLTQLTILFRGAIDLAQKRVQANYKIAVPTYYRGEICLLLPICLYDPNITDLALAIKKNKGFYTAKTCLTLDMAYNDARLIAKPDNDWLIP